MVTILCEILCPPCFNLALLVDNLSNTIIITYLHFDKHFMLGSRGTKKISPTHPTVL